MTEYTEGTAATLRNARAAALRSTPSGWARLASHALNTAMRLHIQHIHFPLPVISYEPAEHPHGEAIRIRMPAADPKGLGVVPGMEGDLEFDDGSLRRIRLGKRWTLHQTGSEVRIRITTLPVSVAPHAG